MVPLSFGCGSAVFAAIATLAPSRAARNAIASPMPRLPPDTNSVLPLSDVIGGLLLLFQSSLVAIRAEFRTSPVGEVDAKRRVRVYSLTTDRNPLTPALSLNNKERGGALSLPRVVVRISGLHASACKTRPRVSGSAKAAMKNTP